MLTPFMQALKHMYDVTEVKLKLELKALIQNYNTAYTIILL